MSETATRSKSAASREYVPGRPRHSDELTTSRSTTPRSSASCGESHSGSPRQRQKTGRSEISSGSTIDAGCSIAVAAEADLDHLRVRLSRAVDLRPRGVRPTRVMPRRTPRLRHEEDRPRRVPVVQAGQSRRGLRQPRRRSPDEVRHRARPQNRRVVSRLLLAEPRQLPSISATTPIARQCRRQERPSRCNSSSATRGPQVPAS